MEAFCAEPEAPASSSIWDEMVHLHINRFFSYSHYMELALLFFIPFLGTVLGSAGVYLFRNGLGARMEKLILGFASGVMIAASVWSLLLPAIDASSYYMAAFGFLLGIAFLLLLDQLTPHLHAKAMDPEGHPSSLSRSTLLMLSVTLHNIPEGMAVGAGAAAMAASGGDLTYASAFALSIGIALQNFPEGMVVSFPLYKEGGSRGKAFLNGVISGVVEPAGAIIAFLFVGYLTSLLPVFLSFAAGAMFYVVVEELIPEASEGEHSNIGTVGAALGFAVMMLLDGIFG